MHENSCYKCVEIAQWLKKMFFYCVGIFDFSGRFKSLCFALEAGFMGSTQHVNLTPILF